MVATAAAKIKDRYEGAKLDWFDVIISRNFILFFVYY